MTTFWIILLCVLGVIFGAVVISILLKRRAREDSGGSSLLLIQNQLNELMGRVDKRLQESSQSQLGSVRDITEKLTRLEETNKQVRDFAGQLQSLQDILKSPKQRGILGEYHLEMTLKNVLPPGQYQLQYPFKNNEKVDAVIFLGKEKILPIDAKFSLENYNRIVLEKNPAEKERLEGEFKKDLKVRIDETAKYVRPNERTMEFAFMFIPSEAVYYDLLINEVGAVKASTKDLIEYAFQKKVIIVSPTTLMAFLQTVLQGLKALQIEESAKEIRKRVEELGRHLANVDQFFDALGKNLGAGVSNFNKLSKEFRLIDKDILKISEKSPNLGMSSIEAQIED